MDLNDRFTEQVLCDLKSGISEAGGNEVFFAGYTDENGVIISVYACARGNINEVPVNLSEARKANVLIHNHPSGNLHPSRADLDVASDCAQKAQGFYIINNTVTDVYAVLEPIKDTVIVKLKSDYTSHFLANGGPLSSISPFFEERSVQLQLVKAITESFNNDNIGVFEAGTGVGKSFAYLIPSMLWAVQNKERVVISTGTINLQQQLAEKDIPLAEKIIGKPVKAVLVKGRQNYICLRRLSETSKDRDLFDEEQDALDKINQWAKGTKTGSRSDIAFMPKESVWQRVNSESDACMGMRCPFREQCFVMKVRKEASDANLLIVNHHLLFADIESRMESAGYDDTAVLPPYNRIVFDEAHGIESAATSFFSDSLTKFRILKQLNLLWRSRKGSVSGFIFLLNALSKEADNSASCEDEISKIKLLIAELETTALELLKNDYTMRLYSATYVVFAPVINVIAQLQSHVASLTGLVRQVIEGIDDEDLDNPAVWEAKSVLRRLDDVTGICKNFCEWSEHIDRVFWIQKLRLNPALVKNGELPYYVQFVSTPLDIAPLMNKGVFEPMRTVVCTSATLSIGKSFGHFEKRSGIGFADQSRVSRGEFPSPFLYDKNMILSVPSDAPFADSEMFQPYIEDAIVQLIKRAKGRTLVLFTSYESLRHGCDTARTLLRNSGINVLRQGDDDRFRLLSLFKEDTASVLFATDSFWEGVDVPGQSLSQVIIVKLPFGVPNDPVFAARSELIQKRGGSPFMELSVPEAIIKFRQGIGRLIRRGDDRGSVVVLDRRIMEKQYGRTFLSSIPKTNIIYRPLSQILDTVERFIQ